jgi:oligopeptidase A
LDNTELVNQILALRRERASLLGFRDFADLVLEDRMAKTGANAKRFIFDLKAKVEQQAKAEHQTLLNFFNAPSLAAWDVAFVAERQRKALYDFDEEALRPYFPLDQVLDGMFKIAGLLFRIEVRKTRSLPVWHPEVLTFDIFDLDGTQLASFYADLHPREDKRGGAWMNALVTGGPSPSGTFAPHLGLICANFTRSIGLGPALLTYDEVRTLFHEFGHLLHHSLSNVRIRSLAGTNVAWDFVELPSQIMENWCGKFEALSLFAAHYQTGALLPRDLFEKLDRARNFRSATAIMRQLGLGANDLLLHTEFDPSAGEGVIDYSRELFASYAPTPLPDDFAMINSFRHLFSGPIGYAAGYYSYLWAEVLDADAFTRFEREGLFDRGVGGEFRRKILSRGDSEDPMVLFRDFMGREPDPTPFLRREGITV